MNDETYTRVDTILSDIYYDPSKQGSFGGRDTLFEAVRHRFPWIRRAMVQEWLSNQKTYQLHKPRNHQKLINRQNAKKPLQIVDIDLIDLKKFSHSNRGIKYIMNIIDVYSRYLWSVPLKNKTPEHVYEESKDLFNELIQQGLKAVQADNGPEFNVLKDYLKQKKVRFQHTDAHQPWQNGIVERVNKTIKTRIYKYLTYTGERKYIDFLDAFVSSYNNSFHTAIGMTPLQAMNQANVVDRRSKESEIQYPPLQAGDSVRIHLRYTPAYIKNKFKNKYYPQWSIDTHQVVKIINKRNGNKYKLLGDKKLYDRQDLQLINIDKTRDTLQREYQFVDADDIEPVEPIATRRTRRNIRAPDILDL